MVRFARTTGGRTVVGDTGGFVPLGATDGGGTDTEEILAAAATGDLSVENATAQRVPADALEFDFPLSEVGKLWGIGLNYVDHAEDLDATYPDEPASFLKPATTVTGPGGPICLPPSERTELVTAEAELGVVLGRTCKGIDYESVDDVIAGVVPVIDMTAEDILQRNPRFLTRAKSFDTFFVAGPWITTLDEIDDVDDVRVRTQINGETIAENEIGNMRFSPRELVVRHSRVMTLEPGDIISTGTPGAGEIEGGDVVRAQIEGIGSLSAKVV